MAEDGSGGGSSRLIAAGVAAAVAVLFIASNTDRVTLSFVVFDITTRVWVGFVVSLVLGALMGQAIGALRRRRD